MKKSVIQTILGMVTLLSLIFACCEGSTFISQIFWTGGWLLVCVISGRLLKMTYTKEEWEEKA